MKDHTHSLMLLAPSSYGVVGSHWWDQGSQIGCVSGNGNWPLSPAGEIGTSATQLSLGLKYSFVVANIS